VKKKIPSEIPVPRKGQREDVDWKSEKNGLVAQLHWFRNQEPISKLPKRWAGRMVT
jgi:hypothetical protein